MMFEINKLKERLIEAEKTIVEGVLAVETRIESLEKRVEDLIGRVHKLLGDLGALAAMTADPVVALGPVAVESPAAAPAPDQTAPNEAAETPVSKPETAGNTESVGTSTIGAA